MPHENRLSTIKNRQLGGGFVGQKINPAVQYF